MDDALKTALWFSTGADYLIINSFLWRDKQALEECLEIVWNNNCAVIREAEEQTPEKRFSSSGLDVIQLYESYRVRTSEVFSDAEKKRMIGQVIQDIRCLCSGMKPAHKEMQLTRNLNERCAIKSFNIGDTVELLGLTSTSTTGQLIDYSQGNYRKPSQVLHIRVAAGLPVLPLDNSENEVILPPAAYRVVDRHNENGTDVVILDALYPLDLDCLIREAEAAYTE